MSDHDDAQAVLGDFVPLGNDDPRVQAFTDAVAAHVAERDTSVVLDELVAEPCDASGVVRPGDVLVLTCDPHVTAGQADMVRLELLKRLPGIGDVVLVPATLAAIYRGGGSP